jgi:type I restriction enzyme R subunit
LIDTYIQAEEPETISPFGDMTLLEIIVKSGIADAVNNLPKGIKGNRQAVAETIENNVRRKIIKEHLIDPAFFDEMSILLEQIIKERKANAVSYEEYLKKIAALAQKVNEGKADDTPDKLKTHAQRAIYNNLGNDLELALKIDATIISVKRDGWRGNRPKELEIMSAIYQTLKSHEPISDSMTLGDPPVKYGLEKVVEKLFDIIVEQKEY